MRICKYFKGYASPIPLYRKIEGTDYSRNLPSFPPPGKKILKFQSKSIFTFLLIADINSRFSFHSLSGFAIFQSTFLCLNFINFSTCQLNLNLSVLLLNIIIMNICLYTSLYIYLSVFRTTAVIKIF